MQTVLPLLVFLFPLAYSPGPGNLFFAANGARFGLRATLPANLGYHLATWIVTLAIGLGFAAASRSFPDGARVLRIAGAGYVLWLAWGFLRAGRLDGGTAARPAGFIDGAVLLVLNPKAYVIIALMFSQFLSADPDTNTALVILITTVFTLNNLAAFLFWTLAGDLIARRFRSEREARRTNTLFGLVLGGVAIWMLAG